MSSLHRVNEVARGQLALFTSAQARRRGLDKGALHRATRRGEIERLRRNVYAFAGAPRTREQAILAAVLAAGRGARASHLAAGWVLSYPDVDFDEIEIVVPTRHGRELDGVRVHRSGLLVPADCGRHRAIPITSPARTLVDLSVRLDPRTLGRAIDDARHRRLVRIGEIEACRERMAWGTGWDRSRRIDAATARRSGTHPDSNSWERMVLEWLRGAGYQGIVQQHRVHVGGKHYKIDVACPPFKVGLEFLGYERHGHYEAFHADAERTLNLESVGWLLLPVTARTTAATCLAAFDRAIRDRGWTPTDGGWLRDASGVTLGSTVSGTEGGWRPVRDRLGLAARIVGSVVMLALLVDRVPKPSAIQPHWRDGALWWLVGALAATLAGIVLSAVRWQQVLNALGLRARVRTLVSHYLAGQFVSNFLPSTIGGDVLRVSRLSASNGESPQSFASVVLERLTGWLVLPMITLAALAINPGLFRVSDATRIALLFALATLAGLLAILWVAAHPRLGGRLAEREGWLRFIGAVHLGISRLRGNPGAAIGVLAVGFAYQLTVVLAALLASEALGLDIGPTAILAFMPAVAMAQVLPISVGGLGVREGAFVLFLHPLGVPTGQAITLGLLVYALNLTVSLLGAPAFAAGGRSARAPVRTVA